jgi:hypothetical protein
VIDVSTPSAPDWVGFVDVFGNFLDVAVEGRFAYLTSWVLFGPSHLRVIDVGTPDQLNHVLADWAPVNGHVDVWADDPEALYYCYGSLLDNQTPEPTTILPQ